METYALQWSQNRPHLYADGQCQEAVDDALVLAGVATTNEEGEWVADRSIICLPAGILGHPSLVATPTVLLGEMPIVIVPLVLTTLLIYEDDRLEKIGVRSMHPDGSPAANVTFSWRLTVLSTFVK
jgi:hypothetical protein